MTNVYEQLARENKVSKLVYAMHSQGWAQPQLLDAMQPHHWAAVEAYAGVKPCSDLTRQMVVERIRRAQQPARTLRA